MSDPKCLDHRQWLGQNYLGNALMKVRRKIRQMRRNTEGTTKRIADVFFGEAGKGAQRKRPLSEQPGTSADQRPPSPTGQSSSGDTMPLEFDTQPMDSPKAFVIDSDDEPGDEGISEIEAGIEGNDNPGSPSLLPRKRLKRNNKL